MKKDIALGQLINFFPAPVIIVGSKSLSGAANFMTAAWFGVSCSVPPILSVAIRPQRLSNKNIKETKCFTVNIPSEELLEKVDFIGTVSGRDVDKAKELGLEAEDGKAVSAPLLKSCPICYECSLKEIISLGTHDLFLGEVKRAAADEDFIKGQSIDTSRIKPLLMFSNDYFGIGKKIGSYGFTKVKK